MSWILKVSRNIIRTGMFAGLSVFVVAAAHAADKPAGGMKNVASVDDIVEAAISRDKPAMTDADAGMEGIDTSGTATNMEVVVRELVRKEIALQKARAEIQRLKDWISKMRDASKRERAVMYYNMGCVWRACKQYRKSEEEFIKAAELDPEDPAVHYNLGILYDDDLKNPEKARKHYRKFLELSQDEADRAAVQEWLSALE